MVAPATRTTEALNCRINRALRANVECPVVLRLDEPRNASAGSVRVANHAGAAPKMIPFISASPKANASTGSDGLVLMGRKCAPRNASASSSRAAAMATSSPAMPPAMASRTQVGDIGASDEQHQSAHGKENLQAAAVLLFHDGDASASRNDVNALLGEVANDVGHPIRRIIGVMLQP